MPFSPEQETALQWIEANRERLSRFHQEIWEYAEPAWREYRSSRAYVELLRSEGFEVEAGSGGMPTAFAATFGDGRPILGSFAEYDATPENSQQPVPYRAPRAGLHPWAAGHTDPHSGLGVAALTGVLATKAAMVRHRLRGTLRFFGEPAEKVCGSKPVHAAKGYYDGADAYVLYHPSTYNTVFWETQFGAYWSAVFTFECTAPEAWIDPALLPIPGHAHGAARAPGALDAVCLMYTTTKYLKETMFPFAGNWTLNECILVGGQATADNLPPRFAQIQYAWRSPDLAIQQRIAQVLEQTARHVAAVAACDVSMRWVTKTRVALPNLALAEAAFRNLERVGPPVFGEEARAFARQIQRNLGFDPMEEPFPESIQRLTTPQDYDAALRRSLANWQRHFAADDYVEYTWYAPTARIVTGRPALRPPRRGYEYPAWVRNALGGVPACIDPMIFTAGRAIAATFVELLTDREVLRRAAAEFVERTAGGVGGARWIPPQLPPDFVPPIDLRWPEYITTERGLEWWIPTPQTPRGMPEGS